MMDENFYNGRKVLVTGHTGFKGAWMCHVLIEMGARVSGYALQPPTNPSLFELSKLDKDMETVHGDIRDLEHLQQTFEKVRPEIVIHMAAQPLVREAYKNPVETYDINVMGTVNVLECIRKNDSVRSFLNVTTDKVYKNREWEWGYRENEELNGHDPYSNSKSCSELVTDSYKNSFLKDRGVAVSTARAGNVIGGGDFAVDRIIPDCCRAIESRQDIVIRNPFSVRPYQHVLEPVFAYLMIAEQQYKEIRFAGSYNVGPNECSCVSTEKLVDAFCRQWNRLAADNVHWVEQGDGGPHEADFLKLDCSKIRNTFGWEAVWDYKEAIKKTVEWMWAYHNHKDIAVVMKKQIGEYRQGLILNNRRHSEWLET